MSTNVIDMDTIKARQKATWMSGDYAHFATYLRPGAMAFLATCDMTLGARVLDVACGAGQTAIPLARQGYRVTGVDIATNLIEAARQRAQADDVQVRFDEGDAEELPYRGAAFDVVFSLIGAMFAPQPDKVAAEMARVCRPGGQIIMGNWTPGGFVGQMFKTIAAHVPQPQGIPPAVLWGDENVVRERLEGYMSELMITRRLYPLKYPFSPAEVVEFFFKFYGPTNRAYASLDAAGQAALRKDLEALWSEYNQATDGSVAFGAEYLEVSGMNRLN